MLGRRCGRASCPPSLLHLPHLGRGGAAFSGRASPGAGLPPPDSNPELASAPSGSRRRAWSGRLGSECGPRASGRGQGRPHCPQGPRPSAPLAGGGKVEGQVSRPGWTMAPPRDVVKIAVQKRDAIPQLIQLDQVTRPGRPPSPHCPPLGRPLPLETAHPPPSPGSPPLLAPLVTPSLAGKAPGRCAEGGVRRVSAGLAGQRVGRAGGRGAPFLPH